MPLKGSYQPICKSLISQKSKFKISKMTEAKKLRLKTFKCSKLSLFYKKKKLIFDLKKMQITANFHVILAF